MSDASLDRFAAPLRQRQTELLQRIHEQRGGTVGRAESAPDSREEQSGDRMQDSPQREVAWALDERETAELEAIEAALQRLSDGRYGECSDCGERIATARLEVNPTATRCIACQGKDERAHGTDHHPSL